MDDYEDVITLLERKSETLKRQYDAVQGALVSLKAANSTPTASSVTTSSSSAIDKPPRRPPKTKASKSRKKGNRPKRYDWVKARNMYDAGKSQAEIAKALGCTEAAVSYRAQQDNWPKRDRNAKRVSVTSQKCPACGLQTDADPCEHCHTVMPLAAKSKRK